MEAQQENKVPGDWCISQKTIIQKQHRLSETPTPILCKDDCAARFICHQCQKTFYNITALKNHRKVHHDSFDGVQGEPRISTVDVLSDDSEFYDYEFIPVVPSTFKKLFTASGLTSCEYLEDTSFLLVRLKNDSHNDAGAKETQPLETASNKKDQNGISIDIGGPFTCTFWSSVRPDVQCQRTFFNCCEYSLHYREEHTKRRKATLRCQVCEKRLDRDAYVSTTLNAELHTDLISKPVHLSCATCSQTFQSKSQYEEHSRMFHSKIKCHVCNICGKRFTQHGGLQQHMRRHNGIKPFVCSFCHKAFTQKAALEQHIRTHTKVKPFRCVVCGKCFSQLVHLRLHMRTHTNIQPFACSLCGKTFKQVGHLKLHMQSHGAAVEIGADAGSSLLVERYAREMALADTNRMQLLNVQPVLDGDTMYYAAELPTAATAAADAPHSTTRYFPFAYSQ